VCERSVERVSSIEGLGHWPVESETTPAVKDLNSGGMMPSEPEIAGEERPNPYDPKSRVDPRGRETKQELIISGFDRRFGENIDPLPGFGACSLLKLPWKIVASPMQLKVLKVRGKLKD
jgi:hypothetical protein